MRWRDTATRRGSRRWAGLAVIVLSAVLLAAPVPRGTPADLESADRTVRSELYPTSWQPGVADAEGRFLHDFSYAGYGYGADVPAQVDGRTVDVTRPPYDADPRGVADATSAIQAAIDDVGAEGGGTVHLPAGTYRVEPPDDSRAVLHIGDDGVVVRGDGAGRTRLYNASATGMRQRAVILVGPDRSDWHYWHGSEETSSTTVPLTRDVIKPTRTLHLASVAGLEVGDWVVLTADTTPQWLAEHPVEAGQVWEPGTLDALVYHRRITAVDPTAETVEIDIPTRYRMLVRDGLRLHHHPDPVVGSGVQDLAIGMRQSDLPADDDGDDDDDGGGEDDEHEREGTPGHAAHQSSAIAFNDAVHGWVSEVRSFRPPGNDDDVHLLSVGIYVRDARNITLQDIELRNPQYRGAGGNGYLYHLMGSDTLVRDSIARDGRHNYLVQAVQATGNVILDSRSVDGQRATELHRHLSAANIFDNVTVDGDTLEMRYRTSGTHAHSATESVMWNVSGTDCTRDRLAISQQFGWGYVIGTRGSGACAQVTNPGGDGTEPRDWVEHTGQGARLQPRSLYLDQLDRRMERDGMERDGVEPEGAERDGEPEGAERDGILAVVVVGIIAAVLLGAGAGVVVARRRRPVKRR